MLSMDCSNWTICEKARVAIPVVIAAVLALFTVSCSVPSTDYMVVNDTKEPLRFHSFDEGCWDISLATLSNVAAWKAIDARTGYQARTYFRQHRCLMIADLEGHVLSGAELRDGATYRLQ